VIAFLRRIDQRIQFVVGQGRVKFASMVPLAAGLVHPNHHGGQSLNGSLMDGGQLNNEPSSRFKPSFERHVDPGCRNVADPGRPLCFRLRGHGHRSGLARTGKVARYPDHSPAFHRIRFFAGFNYPIAIFFRHESPVPDTRKTTFKIRFFLAGCQPKKWMTSASRPEQPVHIPLAKRFVPWTPPSNGDAVPAVSNGHPFQNRFATRQQIDGPGAALLVYHRRFG